MMARFGRGLRNSFGDDIAVAGDIGDLDDVTITEVASGQVIVHNGTGWVNATPTLDFLSNVSAAAPTDGDTIAFTTDTWSNTPRNVFGGATDNTTISLTTGSVVQAGAARTWKDENQSVLSLAIGAAAPSIETINTIKYYAFAGGTTGTDDELHGTLELNHDYAEGTNFFLHVHWFASTSGTGKVNLCADYTICKADVAMSSVTGTPVVVRTIASDEKYVTRISNIVEIDGTDLTIGTNIMYRIYRKRDANNTYADTIGLQTVGIHYLADTLGSQEVTTKWSGS